MPEKEISRADRDRFRNSHAPVEAGSSALTRGRLGLVGAPGVCAQRQNDPKVIEIAGQVDRILTILLFA
jgi:hypothetical protein